LLASQENPAAANGAVSPLQKAQSVPQRGMHGRTYAFDRATGKLQWQMPAFVSHHCLPADQPVESPLLMFTSIRRANNKVATSVLVLDRRTGRNVYEKDLSGAADSSDIVADPAKQTATLALFGEPSRSITFLMTDKPLAPQPPAQTGEMASAAAGRKPGTVDISLSDAIEQLQNTPRERFDVGPLPPGR